MDELADAVDRLLRMRHPGRTRRDYTPASRAMGGEYPLSLIRAYAIDQGEPHWHYVSYGLSELFDNQESGPVSAGGTGFELSLRLRRQAAGTVSDPPRWGLAVLLELSRYVAESGRTLNAGDHLAPQWGARGAAGVAPTDIRAFVLSADPELGRIGGVDFLQVVGITSDESALLDDARTTAGEPRASAVLLGELSRDSALLVTDLERPSRLADPAHAEVLARLSGGRLPVGALLDAHLTWRRTRTGAHRAIELTVGAQVVRALVRTVRAALPRGQQVMLVGGRGTLVVLRPAATTAHHAAPDGLVIDLAQRDVAELGDALLPERGRYRLDALPDLVFEVVPFEIRDADGTLVGTLG